MSLSLVAGGNITPASFVKPSTTANRTVVLAGAGDVVLGISQPGTHLTPLLNLNDTYAAVAGENVRVYTKDDVEGWLQLGGTVAAGDFLKSDGSGFGVTAGSDGDYYGARTMVAGVSGQIIKVQMVQGYRGA